MAGDWMKVEKSTPDKPEIFAIADIHSIDPDAVFGKCFRVWSWFDDHTTNGKANGVSVSKTLVDRLVGVAGFADSMVSVGWLCADGVGVSANNFERHNGKTAKTRALTANRVSKHTNAKLTQKLTLDALPREEKRREDKTITQAPNGFADFWSAYPKKVGKGAAEKAWEKAKADLSLVLAAIKTQADSDQWRKDGGQFIPNPATWISQRRWEDGVTVTAEPKPFDMNAWLKEKLS